MTAPGKPLVWRYPAYFGGALIEIAEALYKKCGQRLGPIDHDELTRQVHASLHHNAHAPNFPPRAPGPAPHVKEWAEEIPRIVSFLRAKTTPPRYERVRRVQRWRVKLDEATVGTPEDYSMSSNYDDPVALFFALIHHGIACYQDDTLYDPRVVRVMMKSLLETGLHDHDLADVEIRWRIRDWLRGGRVQTVSPKVRQAAQAAWQGGGHEVAQQIVLGAADDEARRRGAAPRRGR